LTRKIVITGVTKGIGLAMIRKLIDLGHQVSGCGRSSDAISNLQQEFPEHRFEVVDVANFQSVEQWSKNVLNWMGAPDLLVCNAAIINPNNPLWKVPTADFSNLIDINVKGVFHTIKAFSPDMVKEANGVIVTISSGWGRSTSPKVGPYCASKFAIEGMTKALAEEIPDEMAAIPLSPGIIHTDLLEICYESGASQFVKPEAWAEVAVPFLLDLGPSHNGQSLRIPEF